MGFSRPRSLDGITLRAGILGLVAIGALVLAAFAFAVSSLAASTGEPVAGFNTTAPVELTGAPGEQLHLTLQRQHVLRYATDGLALRLGDQVTEVVGPVEKNWDEAVSGDVGDIDVGIDVRVPEVAPGQVVDGTIGGTVTFAVPKGNGKFNDTTSSVAVPIRINVVTPEESAAFVTERRGAAGILVVPALVVAGISGLVGIIALMGAIALGAWVTWHTPFGRSRSSGSARLGHVAAAGIGLLIAGVSLAVGTAFAIAWLGGPRTDPVPLAMAGGLVVMSLWALFAAREEWLEHRHWPAAALALGMLGGGVLALIGGAQPWLAEASRLGDRSLWEFALFLMMGAALALSTTVGLSDA